MKLIIEFFIRDSMAGNLSVRPLCVSESAFCRAPEWRSYICFHINVFFIYSLDVNILGLSKKSRSIQEEPDVSVAKWLTMILVKVEWVET